MNILLASEVIHPGGAETFILRLAQALHQQGHNVQVFVFYEELLNRELCKIFAPDVTVTAATIPNSKVLGKMDGLMFRLKQDHSFRRRHIKASLKKLIAQHKTDVIHSHLLKVDELCLETVGDTIPVVNTIHGDYLQFFNKTKNNIAIPLLNYVQKAKSNLSKLAKVTCISDKQLDFFKEHFPTETKGKLNKIYNGYRGNITEQPEALREQLGISKDAFVFGMVSRGIAEKGWQIAIDAFLKLNNKDTHLVLVGSSDYLSSLKEQYSQHKNIHFTGHANNPINWINIFDAGLLPSTYPSESLPTVIIEYLYCDVPTISSDAGEITNMTGQSSTPSGIIVPIENDKVSVDKTYEAMNTFITNRERYEQYKTNTKACYQQFDMDKCVEAYTAVYQQAIDKT